jgi:HAD superfamily hydrolase (TIGR01509 family)
MGRVNAAVLDAVTLDAYGTLVTLVDPVPALTEILAVRGVTRSPDVVLAGFRAEVAHYGPRASAGYDNESLARLQRECAGVFLNAVDAGDLDTHEFAPAYAGALRFEVLPGVVESLKLLRALGLELAVVGNWDLTLRQLLDEVRLGGYFETIVHAAAKPAPDGLRRALDELGVEPARALHIGDDEVDELAARAADMQFAWAPVPDAVASLE